MKSIGLLLLTWVSTSFSLGVQAQPVPHYYISLRVAEPPVVDGKLDEQMWRKAPWTADFVDIDAGKDQPPPRFRTRAKMLWDDTYFYIAAELEEPDLWATLKERDAVIFQDNDFEVFLDPDGDTHHYYELELNAYGTVWDLLLPKPYRDGGQPIDSWDIHGLQVGIDYVGTLNQPGDVDSLWTVEIALPWDVLQRRHRKAYPPKPGDQWRVNFSRVQWQVDVKDGRYQKKRDAATDKPLHEDNWVWTPQDAVDMHRPEHWGYVQFSDATRWEEAEAFVPDPNFLVKQALRQLYYRQRAYVRAHNQYASELSDLPGDTLVVEGLKFSPTLYVTPSMYEIVAPGFDGMTVHIRDDGKVWVE